MRKKENIKAEKAHKSSLSLQVEQIKKFPVQFLLVIMREELTSFRVWRCF
jgi:hypothetical protein